jgi:hypothetical protein
VDEGEGDRGVEGVLKQTARSFAPVTYGCTGRLWDWHKFQTKIELAMLRSKAQAVPWPIRRVSQDIPIRNRTSTV